MKYGLNIKLATITIYDFNEYFELNKKEEKNYFHWSTKIFILFFYFSDIEFYFFLKIYIYIYMGCVALNKSVK